MAAIVISAGLALLPGVAMGQVSPDQPSSPSFDVVSVTPNTSGSQSRSYAFQGEAFVATNVPATSLLILAYDVPVDAILSGPKWLDVDRFDIRATFDLARVGPITREKRQVMMRRLLADRFQAEIRQASQNGTGYALLLKRSDGTTGPGMRPSTARCENGGKTCTLSSPDGGRLVGRGVTVRQVAQTLGLRLGTIVVDRTGLEGRYDIDLTFAPDEPLRAEANPESRSNIRPPVTDAVADQLGLVLAKEPIAKGMIYIERFERPTPN